MRAHIIAALVVITAAGAARPAFAQRLPFERSFETTTPVVLDVATDRGKIDVVAGEPGRVVVSGTVTVRVGLNVPVNALELARRVAAAPPIERRGNTFRLRVPAGEAEQRAMTISYQVRVPPDTKVITVTDSGATTVTGVSGDVAVRTQSSAIDLRRLASAEVTTGSGGVIVDGVTTGLSVTTGSSAVKARSLRGRVRLRTQSGAVDADFDGPGHADVETGSSAIRVTRLDGGLAAATQSGRIVVDGTPTAPWDVTTGSSAIELMIRSGAPFNVDAMSQSSDVKVEGANVEGTTAKGRAKGTVRGGGPLVQADSRSGSITIVVR